MDFWESLAERVTALFDLTVGDEALEEQDSVDEHAALRRRFYEAKILCLKRPSLIVSWT